MRARLTGAASLVVLSSLAVPAMAQQAAASGTQLEEVVVQARRVDENLQDVPLAVTALSQEVMREKSINSIMDLKRAAPGVQTTQSPRSDDNVRFTIRGQSQAEVVLTSDSSVGVYIDGIYQSRIFGTRASLFDIDRVEVLKGPQGTLYGKNTTGGAVNIFTRQARIDDRRLCSGDRRPLRQRQRSGRGEHAADRGQAGWPPGGELRSLRRLCGGPGRSADGQPQRL